MKMKQPQDHAWQRLKTIDRENAIADLIKASPGLKMSQIREATGESLVTTYHRVRCLVLDQLVYIDLRDGISKVYPASASLK